MFRLVCLCFVFMILSAEANFPETENPVIRLSLNYDRKENYKVFKDKPMKIVIEKVYARYAWCADKYGRPANSSNGIKVQTSASYEQFVPETEFNNDSVDILYITNVTGAMSTRWGCVVLQEYHGPPIYPYRNRNYTANNLHFNLHVKGARKVILMANDQSLPYVTTNLSVNYDGEANYTYEDSEDFSLKVSCRKAKDNNNQDTLRLEYYNAEGILLFKTKPQVTSHIIFRSVLKSNNDKYYLECIRAARNPERQYRYRTTFLKRDLHTDAVQHAVILSVNGQKISTFLSIEKSYDDYLFKFIDGEVLNVTCRKMDVNMRGTLSFYSDPKITRPTLRSPSGGVISINVPTSDFQNKSLSCGINNTDEETPNARLLFLSDVPDYDVRIRGLSRTNVLYQYTNDEDQWTTEYQYSVNDTLNLTCVWKDAFYTQSRISPYENLFQWKFENQLMSNSAAIKMLTSPPSYYSEKPFTKILDATANGTKIQCIYFPKVDLSHRMNKSAEIILRLKPVLVTEAKRDEDTSDDPKHMIVYIAIGVGVGIAITMVCLVSWRKRTKRASLIENEYDNFSNQNDSPIPAFPNQWEPNYNDSIYAKIDEEVVQENYNYSTAKLNGMTYKRQSNTSENHYTEIDDYFNPKPDGLAANWNTAQSSDYNNQTDTLKATASHNSNNACYNNVSDSKLGTYDRLRHNNLPNNNGNDNYSNVQKPSKSKSVTFRQMSNELRPGRNYSERNTRQDGRNNECKLKPKNDSCYANTGQDIYMQPGDMPKKPNYENNFLHNEKTDNPLDSDYAEPYGEFEVSCKNDFYG